MAWTSTRHSGGSSATGWPGPGRTSTSSAVVRQRPSRPPSPPRLRRSSPPIPPPGRDCITCPPQLTERGVHLSLQPHIVPLACHHVPRQRSSGVAELNRGVLESRIPVIDNRIASTAISDIKGSKSESSRHRPSDRARYGHVTRGRAPRSRARRPGARRHRGGTRELRDRLDQCRMGPRSSGASADVGRRVHGDRRLSGLVHWRCCSPCCLPLAWLHHGKVLTGTLFAWWTHPYGACGLSAAPCRSVGDLAALAACRGRVVHG